MAVIVAFPKCPAPRDPDKLDRTQMAQILFFTGVRYERHAEAGHAGTSPLGGPGAGTPRGQAPQRRRRRG